MGKFGFETHATHPGKLISKNHLFICSSLLSVHVQSCVACLYRSLLYFFCLSAYCIPASNWEHLPYEKCLSEPESRHRERPVCLIVWLLVRTIVRVRLKLCRRPRRILMLSLSLMIIETQHFYPPLLPGNKAERCEQKWMPWYDCPKKLVIIGACRLTAGTVSRRREHRATVD